MGILNERMESVRRREFWEFEGSRRRRKRFESVWAPLVVYQRREVGLELVVRVWYGDAEIWRYEIERRAKTTKRDVLETHPFWLHRHPRLKASPNSNFQGGSQAWQV